MSRADDIKQLFEAVYETQKEIFKVLDWKIKHSVANIGQGYRPNPDWINNKKSNTPSYDEPSQRCAYLIKYAMLHTAMTYDLFDQASWIYDVKCIIEAKKSLNLCSLGSGPGTDIVALLFFLRDNFGFKKCQASLIDQSIGWKGMFESVISKLKSPCYNVSDMVAEESFSFKYLKADLLNINEREVIETIHNADIITMVKFVSAAASKDTSNMIKNVFKAMKRGALLLFIDNAAGGFCEILEENASFYGLKSVFETEKHYKYEEPKFNVVKLGITNQYQSTVVAEMWMKESQDDGWDEIDYAVADNDSDDSDDSFEDYVLAHCSYDAWDDGNYALSLCGYDDWGKTDYTWDLSDSDEPDETDYSAYHTGYDDWY